MENLIDAFYPDGVSIEDDYYCKACGSCGITGCCGMRCKFFNAHAKEYGEALSCIERIYKTISKEGHNEGCTGGSYERNGSYYLEDEEFNLCNCIMGRIYKAMYP